MAGDKLLLEKLSQNNSTFNETDLHVDDGDDGQMTVSTTTIEDTVPFFLEADNHVAEEIEVETSSAVECENNTTDLEVIQYACEITLTYSPAPAPPSVEVYSGELVESDQPMQIILHAEGEPCASDRATTVSSNNINERENSAPEKSAETMSVPSHTSSATHSHTIMDWEEDRDEQQQLECGNKGQFSVGSETESSSESESITLDNNTQTEPVCTTEPNQKNDKESVDNNTTANKEINRPSISAGVDNGVLMSDKEMDKKEKAVAIRVSCIKWAEKIKDKGSDEQDTVNLPITNVTSIASASVSHDGPPNMHHHDHLNDIDETGDENMEQDNDENYVMSQIWVPEITTTIQDEVVQIPDISEDSRIPIGRNLPCCLPPCCSMIRDLWPYLPLWMGYIQIQGCSGSRSCGSGASSSVRPAGFEDPPEDQWIIVDVHFTDPLDGSMRYKCRNCEGFVHFRSFKQKNQLNLSRMKYPCKHCHRKYMTKRQLKLHSLRHSEKTRVCQYCDKRFLTQNELQNHLNTHTREKPFQCPVCFQRFAHSSRYYTHIRNFHKKYDCNDCYSKVCSSSAGCKGFKS